MRYLGSRRTRLSVLHYRDFASTAAQSLPDALHYFAKARPLRSSPKWSLSSARDGRERNVEEVDPRCRDIRMQSEIRNESVYTKA